jgi:hypothetical protein
VWKNLRRVVLVVDKVAYTHPLETAGTGMLQTRGEFSTVVCSSDGTIEPYRVLRSHDFPLVREIVLRRTSGSFFLAGCPATLPHRKSQSSRGGYAVDGRQELAPIGMPYFIPVET